MFFRSAQQTPSPEHSCKDRGAEKQDEPQVRPGMGLEFRDRCRGDCGAVQDQLVSQCHSTSVNMPGVLIGSGAGSCF